ncbi:MAG: HU family DNA-binding protein, partial [Acidimicrobiia bacterium]|nr:HU family DNA-binding protein [Acidimicrobiia bacterium]
MNKTEMAEKLAKKTDLSKAKAAEVIDAIFSSDPGKGIIAVELDADREVRVSGFGTFYTSRSKARTGRNPATGAAIQIAAKKH